MKTYEVSVADLTDVMDKFIFDEEQDALIENINNSDFAYGTNELTLITLRDFCDLVREVLTEERGEEFTEEITQALSFKTLINLEA